MSESELLQFEKEHYMMCSITHTLLLKSFLLITLYLGKTESKALEESSFVLKKA